jgi:ferredoxin/flavodoxin
MNIQTVSCVYFSPTGTTKAIVDGIAQGINAGRVGAIDITKPSNRDKPHLKFNNEVVILAAPVYYGRIPEVAVSYLSTLEAEQTAAVLVVVYGNRDYEDALMELHDIAVAAKFIPVAGGVFVAEHSYSSAARPIAHGRPDDMDIQKAQEFGAKVRQKLEGLTSLAQLTSFEIPGQVPYVEPKNLNMIKTARAAVALTPETDTSKCTECGECAEACPTEAISPDDVTQTDRWKCLICFACVKICPEDARHMNDPHFQEAIQMLHQNCQQRKEPEWYL